MRPEFRHVVDIAPTIYEVLGISPPKVVNGFDQLPIDGTSLATASPTPRRTAEARGSSSTKRQPRPLRGRLVRRPPGAVPPLGHARGRRSGWTPGIRAKDPGSSTTWSEDFSQAHDLAADPARLAAMKARFLEVAEENMDFPDRRRQLAASCIRRTASSSPYYALDLRPERAADAGVHRARRRAAVHDGD